jgi:hypothetical protein
MSISVILAICEKYGYVKSRKTYISGEEVPGAPDFLLRPLVYQGNLVIMARDPRPYGQDICLQEIALSEISCKEIAEAAPNRWGLDWLLREKREWESPTPVDHNQALHNWLVWHSKVPGGALDFSGLLKK